MSKDKSLEWLKGMMVEMIEVTMKELIENVWDISEEELKADYHEALTTKYKEGEKPGPFPEMFVAAAIGEVLTVKYNLDEKELFAQLMDSDLDFIREIKNASGTCSPIEGEKTNISRVEVNLKSTDNLDEIADVLRKKFERMLNND